MRKSWLFLFLLLAIDSSKIYGSSLSAAWDTLISEVNAISQANAEITSLNASVSTLTAEVESSQLALDTLNGKIAAANEQAKKLANVASIAAQTSDVMLRGKINNIINTTDTAFSVVWPDGTRTPVAAQSTVLLNKNNAFSLYKEGNLVGGVILIIPQVNGVDISIEDSQAASVDISYSLLFNLQGLNEAEFPYGALNHVSITRCQTGQTRAHSIFLDSSLAKDQGDTENGLIQDNELWAIDITINYVKSLGDGFIYPRFSTLYTNEFDVSDDSDAPDVLHQATWSKQVVLNSSNSSEKFSTPVFSNNIWSDFPSDSIENTSEKSSSED